MTLRWVLVFLVILITSMVVVWDYCAILWATPSETLSGRMHKVSHEHPEVPFGMGAGLVFCGLLPIIPRRRRWLAAFMVFMLLMAVVAAHCIWPYYSY